MSQDTHPVPFDIPEGDDAPAIEPIPLWGSELFIATLAEHSLIANPLTSLIYRHHALHKTAVASEVSVGAKQNLFESELDFLDGDDLDVQVLSQSLSTLILDIAAYANEGHWPDDASAEVTITESWYHLTQTGGYHDAHSHPNCSWCGIYYLDAGDSDFDRRSGVNRFYDPRVNADHFLDAGSLYLNGQGIYDIQPVAGQVVIFPSYLKHSALPYFGSKDRVVVAFNARVDFA
jgi:uncharacterized protein (TIGR02466 family)